MDADGRRRLLEAVEQARSRAAHAADQLAEEEDVPRAVESAIRDAEQALARVANRLAADD